MDETKIERPGAMLDDAELERRIALRNEETKLERSELERKALEAGFELAMKVRSYLGTLHAHDNLLRAWVLRQLEAQLPKVADEVITAITDIEDLDFFEEHCYPR